MPLTLLINFRLINLFCSPQIKTWDAGSNGKVGVNSHCGKDAASFTKHLAKRLYENLSFNTQTEK